MRYLYQIFDESTGSKKKKIASFSCNDETYLEARIMAGNLFKEVKSLKISIFFFISSV